MRSSAAIRAEINRVKNELEKLESVRVKIDSAYAAISCAAGRFSIAGEAIKEAGEIGGRPFDYGKTEIMGQDLLLLKADIDETYKNILSMQDSLESKLASLEEELDAAIAWEQRQRKKIRRFESMERI